MHGSAGEPREGSGAGPRGVIVIGGGQSGLATAFYLLRAGIDVLVLDAGEAPGGSWREMWPSMTLFSTAEFSNLPGIPMPAYEGFPPASHVVDYLAAYERRYAIPVERPVRVTRVEATGAALSDGGRFRIHAETPDSPARTWTADHVVAATGTWSAPFVPAYPGRFHGKLWHSATYPGPDLFRGSSVAVVGGANSAAQIAAELTRVADVTWFTRGEPRWMPDDVDGRVLFHRNRQRMLAVLRGEGDPGADSALGDIVMVPEVLAARDEGRLRATPVFHSLDELSDAGVDHLIWCTGFRPALGPVRSLLDGRQPTVPGLHLVGYGDWTGPGSATITGLGPHAKATARAIAETYGKKVR
ncbi:FAD-dependent oxidoreductase [Corynebacterium freneyi]|uniref:FAD-dependent oxidoreductase n=1 Tax=Corynebacterium freneyi TaxID=134034 RepID=UPI000B2E7CD5|nr:FAD-dependent oxidoreductase [Corynebacterium freneyi]